jgi:hypothetical protein
MRLTENGFVDIGKEQIRRPGQSRDGDGFETENYEPLDL